MVKNQEKKFGLAFDSGLKLICDAPGKKISHTSMRACKMSIVYGCLPSEA